MIQEHNVMSRGGKRKCTQISLICFSRTTLMDVGWETENVANDVNKGTLKKY
jgi:hypothetical protein